MICSDMPYLPCSDGSSCDIHVTCRSYAGRVCVNTGTARWLGMQATYISQTLRCRTTAPAFTTSASCRTPSCGV